MIRTRLGWCLGLLFGAAVMAAVVSVRPAETQAAGDAIIFTLKKDFIAAYKNRVGIEADMSVDHAGKIHAEKDDGEIHIGGRANQIGLPFVAEIMHAKSQKAAVKTIRDAEGQDTIKVKGAWRIWCEH